MHEYMLRLGGRDAGVIRLSDNAFIPNKDDNKDWMDFLAWEADGNAVDDYDEELMNLEE